MSVTAHLATPVRQRLDSLATLQQSAQALSAPWRRTVSITAFVDFLEVEIARRSAG